MKLNELEIRNRSSRPIGHGDPIPGPDGSFPERQLTPLPEVGVGNAATLRRVDTNETEELRYIARFGLEPGTALVVLEQQPFEGPVTIEIAGKQQVIGHHIASALRCEVHDEGRD